MRIILSLLTICAFVSPAIAHQGKGKHGCHHGGDDDDHDQGHGDGQCEPYPPTTTTTTTTKSSTTSSLLASCTFTGTQTYYSSGGCNGLTCETGFCIIDAAATKSCGCDKLVIVTKTTTICPTKTPCYQCATGWGTFIETQSCTSTPPPPAYT